MTFPPSDHFNGKTFFNPTDVVGDRGWLDLLKWKLNSRPVPWPRRVPVAAARPPAPPKAEGIAVTWVGHSTFLLQTMHGNFLTDPVFSERAGPFPGVGPLRAMAPGIAFDDLPPIQAVLLSHDHYDHCDLPTLRRLARQFSPVVVAPLGYRSLLAAAGCNSVLERDWWQEATLPGGADVTIVPAKHWCRRRPWGMNVRLWGGFMLRAGGRQLYFAGDTGYHHALFEEIRRRCGAPDLALLPIGAYEPRWFMADAHMNPDEAVQAHGELGTRRSVGMHWGTFCLTDEGREEPVQRLAEARTRAGLRSDEFAVLEPGASLVV